MSKKTLRKRIALVAVSALGFGILTSVSANAATGDGVLSQDTVNSIGVPGAVAGSALAKTATVLTTGQISVTTASTAVVVVSAGAVIVSATGASINASQSAATSNATTPNKTNVIIKPTGAAGTTFTISGYDDDTIAAPGALADVITVTIASASQAGTASATNSEVNFAASTYGLTTAGVDEALRSAVTRGNPLTLKSVLKDVYKASITTAGSFVVEVSTGAVVAVASSTGSLTKGAFSTAVLGTDPSTAYIRVDEVTAGSGWAGTIKVSYNGVVIATKTGVITGDPTKIVLTPSAVASGSSSTAATFQVYDAAGNVVVITAAALVEGNSSNPAVLSGSVGYVANSATDAGSVRVNCATGASGTSDVIMAHVTSGGTIVRSNSATLRCGGDRDTYKASFDKASYKQGEIATLTVRFLDSKGNPANSVTAVSAATADQVITAPQMTRVTGYANSAKVNKDGSLVYTFTVGTDSGVVAGSYNAVVSFPTVNAVNGANQTVAYEITAAASVSNAEVLAAIVKLIASINKQITKLQKLINRR